MFYPERPTAPPIDPAGGRMRLYRVLRVGAAAVTDSHVSDHITIEPEPPAIGPFNQYFGGALGLHITPHLGVELAFEGYETEYLLTRSVAVGAEVKYLYTHGPLKLAGESRHEANPGPRCSSRSGSASISGTFKDPTPALPGSSFRVKTTGGGDYNRTSSGAATRSSTLCRWGRPSWAQLIMRSSRRRISPGANALASSPGAK